MVEVVEAVAARRARVSKTSRVLLRRRENWRGVRRGARVLVVGSWEAKMVMWRGLFCRLPDALASCFFFFFFFLFSSSFSCFLVFNPSM